MLVLTRRVGEEIVIAGGIRITVLAVEKGRVRVGVTAPAWVSVDRGEVAERRWQEAPLRVAPAGAPR
jgi:carbon storage regulator